MASVASREGRFVNIKRDYTQETVKRLSGSVRIEYTLAKRGAERLWTYLTAGPDEYMNVLGAMTGILQFVNSNLFFIM